MQFKWQLDLGMPPDETRPRKADMTGCQNYQASTLVDNTTMITWHHIPILPERTFQLVSTLYTETLALRLGFDISGTSHRKLPGLAKKDGKN